MLYHVMVKPLFIRGSHLLHYQGANTDWEELEKRRELKRE